MALHPITCPRMLWEGRGCGKGCHPHLGDDCGSGYQWKSILPLLPAKRTAIQLKTGEKELTNGTLLFEWSSTLVSSPLSGLCSCWLMTPQWYPRHRSTMATKAPRTALASLFWVHWNLFKVHRSRASPDPQPKSQVPVAPYIGKVTDTFSPSTISTSSCAKMSHFLLVSPSIGYHPTCSFSIGSSLTA